MRTNEQFKVVVTHRGTGERRTFGPMGAFRATRFANGVPAKVGSGFDVEVVSHAVAPSGEGVNPSIDALID